MKKPKQWFEKIPTLVYVIVIFALGFLGSLLGIEKNSPAAIALSLPYLLCVIMLVIRFLNQLKAKGSGWYHVFRFLFGYFLIGLPAALFIVLDVQSNLKGLLMVPGIALEAGLLIWLFIRNRLKRSGNTHFVKEESSSSYSFEKLCGDLSAGLEIEFTYDNVRYLFIPENGHYYFKRIVSKDPYEYEILAEEENPLECIDSSTLTGRKMTDIWPEVKDIEVF
ncbi:MAG: hypothetical protein AAGU32_20855 [Bacillota bacterium]